MTKARWVKLLGLAGVLGVVTTGVLIGREERERRSYTSEQIRARLRERHAEASTQQPRS